MTTASDNTVAAPTALLAKMSPQGLWTGRLSSSATATATAISALYLCDRDTYQSEIQHGLKWLARTILEDGSFGDSPESPGNLTTTLLVWAAFMADESHEHRDAATRCQAWIEKKTGSAEPAALRDALLRAYGDDRTFSVPVLVLCTAMGRFNDDEAWRSIPALPFELSVLPGALWKLLRLQVVSYALPALITMGLARHTRAPSANPFARCLRSLTTAPALRVLEAIQPSNGGFLEATPLCSFVCVGLFAARRETSQVACKSLSYIVRAQRPDGSWPIDEDLETWNTTLAVQALSAGRRIKEHLDDDTRDRLTAELISRQHTRVHPYTRAAPGGWSWTDLPGAVPDADDTSSTLIALRELGACNAARLIAIHSGVEWLLELQNKDGGIPTFCRGWSQLPFDKSCPDISAHALAAVSLWHPELTGSIHIRVQYFLQQILAYLERSQRDDGAWIPLWFGNQSVPSIENPVFGTARVLLSASRMAEELAEPASAMLARGRDFLLMAQNDDGSWGGSAGISGTIEETGLAMHALLENDAVGCRKEILKARDWLYGPGESQTPAPIGLYFARLWYSEEMYPDIFRTGALESFEHHKKALAE